MSEKFPTAKKPETHQPAAEADAGSENSAERQAASVESLKHSHEKQVKSLEVARLKAEQQSESVDKINERFNEQEPSPPEPSAGADREIHEMAFQRQLNRARRNLSPYGKVMSRIIHQPAIDSVSEAAGKTIGRPSGILGGGIVAFLGTAAYYYITKHYGYSYNAFVFLLLLFLGFILGWILELSLGFVKILRKK